MNTLKIALCQMMITSRKMDNLTKVENMVAEAARRGAGLVVLPEIFNVPYDTAAMAANAELFPGPTAALLSDLARTNRIVLVGGSIPEKDGGGNVYNASYIWNQEGSLIGRHRKMHLFDIDIPGQISFKESDVLSRGNSLQIIRNGQLVFAVIICYDVRFPELARLAALQGAQLLIIPAAFNMTTGPAHWQLLMRSRAADNQIYVIACSPARNRAAGYQAWGHSLIVDPWGSIIIEGDAGEEIIEAEIDLSMIDKVRAELPLLQHRRTDIYELRLIEKNAEDNNT